MDTTSQRGERGELTEAKKHVMHPMRHQFYLSNLSLPSTRCNSVFSSFRPCLITCLLLKAPEYAQAAFGTPRDRAAQVARDAAESSPCVAQFRVFRDRFSSPAPPKARRGVVENAGSRGVRGIGSSSLWGDCGEAKTA